MTVSTNVQSSAEKLAQEHRVLGAGEPLCQVCGVPPPCPTMDVIADLDWFRSGYTLLLSRLIPFTSFDQTKVGIASARDIIKERLRGRPR